MPGSDFVVPASFDDLVPKTDDNPLLFRRGIL